MNWLGHLAAAGPLAEAEAFAVGCILPDLLLGSGAELPLEDGIYAPGIHHHLATDQAFHRLPRFLSLMTELRDEAGLHEWPRGPRRAGPHVALELALDAALAADPALLARFEHTLKAAHRVPDALDWTAESGLAFRTGLTRIAERGGPLAYGSAPRLARILTRRLGSRPRLALPEGEVDALRTLKLAEAAIRLAAAEAKSILEDLASATRDTLP